MIAFRKHARAFSRLMAGLFAMQLVLTGFCLLTEDAHAMPMAAMNQMSAQHAGDFASHCSKTAPHDDEHQAHSSDADSHHSDGCFHCDDSDMFVKVATVDIPVFSPVLALMVIMPEAAVWSATRAVTTNQISTGPPRSSSLLYTTTQRILI